MATRLRVGVIGCGVIAQVMHLHYLHELSDRFELVAVCDVAADLCSAVAAEYGVPHRFSRWQDLLHAGIDAVLILTSGSHAPIAIAAAEAGVHMLVEKPLCFSVAEGKAIIEAVRKAGTTLMVGYNKRYDPAYHRMAEEAGRLEDLRLARVTTLESPFEPYIAHYPLHRPAKPPCQSAEQLADDTHARIAAVVGTEDLLAARVYHQVLLDSMVHEFNAVRGILGEPERLDFVQLREQGLTAVLRFGQTHCIFTWVDLPGIAAYQMELALYAPKRRLALTFPSPFLRNMPAELRIEGGDAGTTRSWRTSEVCSYAASFCEELLHFHDSVCTGRPPVTTAEDALRDVALCEAMIVAHRTQGAVRQPTTVAD